MKKLFFCLLIGLNFSALAAEPVNHTTLPSLAPMLQKIMPSVVDIAVEVQLSPIEIAARRKGELALLQAHGSGVVIDAKNAYVLTNAHVITNAKTITVTLSDGVVSKAKLIGSDTASDIAVLQIRAKNLKGATLGDSDKLRVGDFVAAIGSPFGPKLSQSVTSGIISALQRSNLGIEGYENFIQTDASINPGNSGGALVNLQGELIGINTAILSTAGGGSGSVGIGFAIPINMAHSIMQQIVRFGKVNRGLLGITVQELTPQLAEAFQSPTSKGAVLSAITPDSPADKAGLMPGDIVTTIDGRQIISAPEVRNLIGLTQIGKQIHLGILRNKQKLTKKITIAHPKEHHELSESKNPFLFGVALDEVDEDLPIQGRIRGVRVLYLSANSPAMQNDLGLRPGDVIVSANGQTISTRQELYSAIQLNKARLLLRILRGQGALYVVITPKGEADAA